MVPGGGLIAAGNRGEGSENLPLCRNRVAAVIRWLSRNACRGTGLNHSASHRNRTQYNTMQHISKALHLGACSMVPALIHAGYVTAQEVQNTELPPITVSAHGGLAIPYDSTGVSVEVVDIAQMKREGIYTAAEALTTLPGVYITPGGGTNQKGNVAPVVIRGMSSDSYTSTMIDGMRLASNGGDTVITSNVLGRTDLFTLSNLELLKGSQGAVYGGGAMGGVIFMETPEGKGEPSLTLFQDVGSHDSYTGNIVTQGRSQNLAWFLAASYTRTDNDVQQANGNTSAHRNAFESESRSEVLRLDYFPNEDNQLTITYRREDSEFGYDSMDPFWPAYNHYRFRSSLFTLKWQTKPTKELTSSMMAGYYCFDADYGGGYLQDMRNFQLEWRNEYRLNDAHTTTASLAWNRNDFDCLSGGTTDNQYKNQENIIGLSVEHRYTPTQNWNISLAGRLDHSNVHDALFSTRAAASYSFNNAQTRVFSSVGTGYRAPSSFQRSTAVFRSPFGAYIGNPDLSCEQSVSVDAGIEHHLTENHRLSLTFFHEQRTDAIKPVWDQELMASRYVNTPGHWTCVGAEVALQGSFASAMDAGYKLSWTYTQPKTSDDTQIPSSVRQTWVADVHCSPFTDLTTGFGFVAAVGRSHYAEQPYSKLDNYYSLRWYAQYKLNEHVTLHMAVENLTNQKYVTEGHYMDPAYSFISAGTTIHAGCTVTF